MDFEKEDRQRRSGDAAPNWKKEDTAEKKEFDFDDFLTDDLEDRITAALDGRDVLAPDAFGESVPSYTPRRAGDGEHGRHEAPEPVSTAQVVAGTDESEPVDPSDPRYAAPERPRVVVAEPPPTAYVAPPGGGGAEPPAGEGKPRKGLIWAVVILAVIAAAIGILLAILSSGSHGGDGADATPAPTSQSENTPSPTSDSTTPAPTDTPAGSTPTPTAPPQVTTYHVTVTAGSGGSVTPSGVVSVEEGGTVTFTIRPNAGYELSQLLLDGSPIELTDTVRIAKVAADHTLYAVFRQAATPTPAPTPTPTPEPTSTPTPEPTPTPTPEPTPEPTEPPIPNPEENELPEDG